MVRSPSTPNPCPAVVPWLVASLTLGLAPFTPEPHLLGKLRWVAGGAVGMGATDWFDLVLHGAPWAGLLVMLARALRARWSGG
ncbi:MAG: hypothetical protein AB2A00_35975 [Myxococcota bacterium]